MSTHQSQGGGNGPSSAGGGMSNQTGGQGQPPQAQSMSQQNLNQIVLEYLTKKGYARTEQTLRQESAHLDKDGRPIVERTEDLGNEKYGKGLTLFSNWVETGLDIYKFELRKLNWPIFVYSYLELVFKGFPVDADKFFKKYSLRFEKLHADDIRIFGTVTLPQHISDNRITNLYWTEKYRVPINQHIYFTLITFLENNEKLGGSVIIYLLNTYCTVTTTSRGPLNPFSFEAITSKVKDLGFDDPNLQEGIEGVFTGVGNKEILANNNSAIKLGLISMEPELANDVRAELEEEDAKFPPRAGQRSLVEEFDLNIKREDTPDAPARTDIPYPPSRARDVMMEVQKIKENRDRFKIDSRTGGIGPGVSVCMWTFHNHLDSVSCIEFSGDNSLIAVGTQESYIRVWSLAGEPLISTVEGTNATPPSFSRRLVGHSGPVYSLSFSPSITGPANDEGATSSKLLLSVSGDGTVRLWSLETWTTLVVYKGHNGPVWGVEWGPFGHYFATCGWDKTVRIWSQDHISALRLLVGHDDCADQVAWHPNGAYVFSASSGADKTVRMWSMVTGDCVRVLLGHTTYVSSLTCAPNGKILASGDTSGTIILWDLTKNNIIKRCKGHGVGGIWSLSFSAESTALVSGGADGTVRVWDVELPAEPFKGDGEVIATAGQADANRINGASATAAGAATAGVGGSKTKSKGAGITPDQISAFPTKKTPVQKVKFTRMNLVIASGCYNP